MQEPVSMEKIVSLAKRRGFVFPGSQIYGGLANSWDYGPLGTELKNNIKKLWWQMFVQSRDDMYGIDAALIMNRRVWQASGHEGGFSDPLVECKKCHGRFREDQLEERVCPSCGSHDFTESKSFNLMFQTFIGPAQEDANKAYLRPETAQAMFVDFKQIVDAMSPKLPFGIAQVGKAFRNEITPGNFIFRTREFEQMEIEYFIKEQEWETWFEYWLSQMKEWMHVIGLDEQKVHYLEVPEDERAHYSKRTVDIEFDFPFGKKELYGLAYRGDFDLKSHITASGEKLEYFDEESKERIVPHVIEPSLGVDRTFLAVLTSAYKEDEVNGEVRTYLDIAPILAPYKAAVFPLVSNKEELVRKAQEVRKEIMGQGNEFMPVAYDRSGNIGKRYRKQDEIGTPFCVTVDHQTLEDDTVTVRDRTTTQQQRIAVQVLRKYIRDRVYPPHRA